MHTALQSTRDGFGQALLELGDSDPRVVVLTADLSESMRVDAFAKKFPHRFIQCGVAEQNMMGVAAGLALSGKVPFVCSYAVFSPGRNWDQLRVLVCYSNTNVKVIGGHTGLSVGPDGATHQALEDIAITRVLPNMSVIVPADGEQTRQATIAMAQRAGPMYLRLTRDKSPDLSTSNFQFGKADILRKGNDITLVGCGPILARVIEAAAHLHADGMDCEVINLHTIKPIDSATLVASAQKTKKVVTIEDHQIMGGMGSAVCEVLASEFPVPVKRMGMDDVFGQSGKPDELYKHYHLDTDSIVMAIKKFESQM